jgi:4-amino-4-deoxy-L-arabinose transferase-like glycosyltransferase
VLAALMSLGYSEQRSFQVVAVAVESLNLLIIYLLAAKIFGRGAGVLAAVLWLFLPRSYAYIVFVLREPYIVFFFLLGVLAVLKMSSSRPLFYAAFSGLMFGAGTYFKETVLLTVAPAVIWICWLAWRRKDGRLAAGACLLVVFSLVTIAPWIVRNSIVLGEASGFSTFGWYNIKRAIVDPKWVEGSSDKSPQSADANEGISASAADRAIRAQVIAFVRQEPAHAATKMLLNMAGFWSPVSNEVFTELRLSTKDIISGVYSLVCCVFAFMCLWRVRHRPEAKLVFLILAALTAAYALFPPYPRFRYPYDSLLIVFAAGELYFRLFEVGTKRAAEGQLGV